MRDDLNETSPAPWRFSTPLNLSSKTIQKIKQKNLKSPIIPKMNLLAPAPFPSPECYIEREDYMDDAPNKFKRFTVGREVRLRGAYCVTCTRVEKNAAGEVIALYGTYDPETRGVNHPTDAKYVELFIGFQPFMHATLKFDFMIASSPQKTHWLIKPPSLLNS